MQTLHDVTETQNKLLLELLSLHSPPHEQPLVTISTSVPEGRGLVFTQDVKPHQALLTLPPQSLFNPKTLADHLDERLIPSSLQPDSSINRLSSPQALSFVLARWRASLRVGVSESTLCASKAFRTLHLFAQILPKRFDTVPLVWLLYASNRLLYGLNESDDGNDPTVMMVYKSRFYTALLAGMPRQSGNHVPIVEKRFLDDWNRIQSVVENDAMLLGFPKHAVSSSLLSEDQNIKSVRAVTMTDFLWAWLCVNSRCIFLDVSLPAHSDNFTMAPLLDMANHTSDEALECKVGYTASGGLELRAPTSFSRPSQFGSKGLKKGDQCFITYGASSNTTLLSEYGFVLPRRLNSMESENNDDDDAKPLTTPRKWTGNRYSDVCVDDYIQDMLHQQGAIGDIKIEILQNRGYWGDFTIHPSPSPAHPSYRLVPALRLLALDLSSLLPTKQKHTNQQPFTKTLKPAKRSSFHTKPVQDALEGWESTLSGHQDLVSEENESAAHQLLVHLCERLEVDTVKARQNLDVAKPILDEMRMEIPAGEWVNDCIASFEMVQQLLDEEAHTIQLVKDAALSNEEW